MASLTVSSKQSPFPWAAVATAYATNVEVVFEESAKNVTLQLDGSEITNEADIVLALAKSAGISGDSSKSAAYFEQAKTLPTITAHPQVVAALDGLDDHLALRTFLIGHDVTAADWALWGSLKSTIKIVGLLKNNNHPHLLRWYSYFDTLESTQAAIAGLAAAKSSKARNTKTAAGFSIGLENAIEGQVVTRFPPEPSGYLHIGHAKAALLNQYFAKMYKGKLIIRFDDTNPTKERAEFEETILEDLALLGIHADQLTHTSDYFDYLFDLAVKLIKTGQAYADDTEQLQMRAERMDGIASKNRDASVEENLKRFDEMKAGTTEGLRWCIRAKMSINNPNKAMRDPVVYRCNIMTHHRTGDKWKVYPTYDFACPVVDSLEGVTHALRTNEYRDRNPQYQWMIDALELRKVNIWDFSRLNFIYTLLSKRKLHWFVEKGLVRGWDDPRFPTVRGIRRRGMTVEALSQFMLGQGPSSAVVSLEWDSIWAMNKKVIDPVAPRHWAIVLDKKVLVTLTGGPATAEIKAFPKHKKNPDIGEKKTVFSSTLLIEQEDAISFDNNEEITLMDWGNAFVRSKTFGPSGEITAIAMDLHVEGDFRKTSKKITWLAAPTVENGLIPVTLLDYDYLITKKKLEENDDVKDFVTPVTEFRTEALADANVVDLKPGDIMQFERKGYFILDGIAGEGEAKRYEFILIPDGKQASIASKAGVVVAPAVAATVTLAKAAAPEVSAVEKASTSANPNLKMYHVTPVDADVSPITSKTTMYPVTSVYKD